MSTIQDFKSTDPIAWCPGCGNFSIVTAVKKALVTLDKKPNEVVLVSGIGQAAKLPHYIKCNCFNGLHGRALPVAVGAKIAHRDLTVIVTTGDGDCYGEGGNHFMHTIRRNIDITLIVHDNQIYGLTKGQASPTTDPGHRTKIQPDGVIMSPFRPLELAVILGAGYVARGYAANADQLSFLISEGIRHKGFSLIDVLQPCPSFNKVNTYDWYAHRIYDVNQDRGYDPKNRIAALQKAEEWGDRIPTGIIYTAESETYEERSGIAARPPLVEEDIDRVDLDPVLKDFF